MKDGQVNFRVEPKFKKEIDAVCFALGETRAEFIRSAIKDRIQEKARKNSLVSSILVAVDQNSKQRGNSGHE
jgi:metal-responsive CopG/Arc/MetJ family transcriptional regulator